MGELDFDFLAVDGGPVELLDGVFGVLDVLHGDEGVSLAGDEHVVHTAKLVKLPLDEAPRAAGADTVDEQLDAVAVSHRRHLIAFGSGLQTSSRSSRSFF